MCSSVHEAWSRTARGLGSSRTTTGETGDLAGQRGWINPGKPAWRGTEGPGYTARREKSEAQARSCGGARDEAARGRVGRRRGWSGAQPVGSFVTLGSPALSSPTIGRRSSGRASTPSPTTASRRGYGGASTPDFSVRHWIVGTGRAESTSPGEGSSGNSPAAAACPGPTPGRTAGRHSRDARPGRPHDAHRYARVTADGSARHGRRKRAHDGHRHGGDAGPVAVVVKSLRTNERWSLCGRSDQSEYAISSGTAAEPESPGAPAPTSSRLPLTAGKALMPARAVDFQRSSPVDVRKPKIWPS